MPSPIFEIEFTNDERNKLIEIIDSSEEPERAKLRAKALLYSDKEREDRYTTTQLAQLLGTTNTTIKTIRAEYKAGGLETAVNRKARTVENGAYKLTDEITEKILELYHSDPPEGHKRWSSRLLSSAIVECGILDDISPSSVQKIIKREEQNTK